MDYKRNFRRSEIRMRCPCRLLDGVPLEIELLDLSERGCRARSVGFTLHVGQALRIFPEGCDAFTATVRRSDDDVSGIEFDAELPHTVFERMRSYVPLPEDADEQEPGPLPEALPEVSQPQSWPEAGQVAHEPAPVSRGTPQSYGSLLDTGKGKPRKKMAIS
jgi:hypothetical protein